ncbi:hypothetical protein [Desulfitobacterium sp.]|uniref:hypothetical protein n=1 Tax=Desulfitobacterium sp. TaxID=49981 RepID=UPI002C60EEAA|nr:hypothetical protein [Desulfitobacterium sp.]HVJ50672.1 hypothetical protein [Desulfitobacterium sp.]
MKSLLKKLSSIMIALVMVFSISAPAFAQSPSTEKVDTNKATYEITIGDTTLELTEGEKAAIPLERISNSNSSGIQPLQAFPGDAGTLYLWADAGTLYYNISLTVTATSFAGLLSVTDLTSGFSGGNTPINKFVGSISTSNISGHTYGATMSGYAYFLGSIVARVKDNYYIWDN